MNLLRSKRGLFIAAVIGIAAFGCTAAAVAQSENPHRQFTFSWPFVADGDMRPRGGTSRGAPVVLDHSESPAWRALRAQGIDDFERDRRAILAMAGGFRTSFDFIETVGFAPEFAPQRPYQSWGTEYIYVVEDTGTHITLQHIMAMFIRDNDGDLQGPFVQKHWRQEWRYEAPAVHQYVGNDRWSRVVASDVKGKWSQAVYQVDDSPRYAAFGRWEHNASFSAWTSDAAWRPLPRRESSVRDDYDVLIGTNRHTILPSGWVQEEENLKAVLDADGHVDERVGYRSRELGVNRYERIVDFDFSAADSYWEQTSVFWADVRQAWQDVFDERTNFQFTEEREGRALWQAMFEYASKLEEGEAYNSRRGQRFVRETIEQFIN